MVIRIDLDLNTSDLRLDLDSRFSDSTPSLPPTENAGIVMRDHPAQVSPGARAWVSWLALHVLTPQKRRITLLAHLILHLRSGYEEEGFVFKPTRFKSQPSPSYGGCWHRHDGPGRRGTDSPAPSTLTPAQVSSELVPGRGRKEIFVLAMKKKDSSSSLQDSTPRRLQAPCPAFC